MSENFDANTLDTNKWSLDNLRFEMDYSGVADSTAVINSGVLEISSIPTEHWWPGLAISTAPIYQASLADPLNLEFDRVLHSGSGSGTRTAVWITDANRSNYVCFADNTEGNLGWSYNWRIGQSGDRPYGAGADIAAFNGGAFDDGGLHRVNLVANGATVQIYVDGGLGIETPFPFSSGLRFEVGAYARDIGDSIMGQFDNLVVTGAVPVSTVGPIAVARQSGQVVLTWTGTGALREATDVTGPWTSVAGAASPYTIASPGVRKFYRLTN